MLNPVPDQHDDMVDVVLRGEKLAAFRCLAHRAPGLSHLAEHVAERGLALGADIVFVSPDPVFPGNCAAIDTCSRSA